MAGDFEDHLYRSQLKWGINLFRAFLQFAAKREELQLLEITLNDEMSVEDLNRAIASVNQEMKTHVEPILYAPFPLFSVAREGNARAAILDQLDMVERTLSEAAYAKLIDWDEESVYFADILKLFCVVEEGKMQPSDAMAILDSAIEKINGSLPESSQLPQIDLTAYEAFV